MKKIYYFIVASAFLLMGQSCKTDDSKSELTEEEAKKELLQNIANYGAKVQLEKTKEAFVTLKTAVNSFSENQTVEQLTSLREKFIQALLEWKSCEIFEIGEVKAAYIYGSINFWPADTDAIENKIETAETVDALYIKKLGAPLRSISAIEYLLFSGDKNQVVLGFKNQENRRKYLFESVNYLVELIEKIQKEWETYTPVFIQPDKKSLLDDGQNIALNTIVQQLENIKGLKLGIALGDKNGGSINPEKLEAYRSETSLDIIKNNLKQVELMFFGNYENSTNIGFDDLLVAKHMDYLNAKAREKFDAVYENINQLKGMSLHEAVQVKTSQVKELQESVNQLIRFFKKDVKKATAAVILISDTDGD